MRRVFLFSLFLAITPINLGVSFFSLSQLSRPKRLTTPVVVRASSQLYAALPQNTGEILGEFTTADARPVIVEKYLEKHSSPFSGYGQALLDAADKYSVDYRLIVAIAQCESNLCKHSPEGSFNCWGFENGATKFTSWEHAFERVAKTLREGYLDQGLLTPDQIMPKYAPPSVEKGGPWARCVNQFMNELEYGKVD